MLKKTVVALTILLSAAPVAAQMQIPGVKLDYLTGVTRLACEAILCLSSGTTPSECKPSLNHYFAILVYHKGALDWGATLAARRAFLNLCPASGEPGMPGLIKALSEGGGRCDAAYLNTHQKRLAKKVRRIRNNGDAGDTVYAEEFYAVNDALPTYCTAYSSHEWTYEIGVKYIGTPCTGGRWVDQKDYETELAKWKAQNPQKPTHPRLNPDDEECKWVDATMGSNDY